MQLPDDADGDAMRRILAHGSDPTQPMEIDFMVACPDLATARRIAPIAATLGYATKVAKIDEENKIDPVTCYCTKTMLLDYEAVVASQNELDAIARIEGGYIDGWGTFGNAPENVPTKSTQVRDDISADT